MARNYVDKSGLLIPQQVFGVCVWTLPNGKLLMDSDKNILCAEGSVGDPKIERQVAEAAAYWSDNAGGRIRCIEGARKVSDSERDDQMERLIDGDVPDPLEDVLDPSKKMRGTHE
tara:strand:+ start:2376 stop:2720 length:345 start_codon:yes stop_codon:yes gene_type:complete